MGKAPASVTLPDGRVAERDLCAEHSGRNARGELWPMEPCVASGVNAAQAGELRKFLLDHGCPTEVTRDGDPIYRNPEHRKRALRLRHMHDRSAYC
jgi:hypothetical protein